MGHAFYYKNHIFFWIFAPFTKPHDTRAGESSLLLPCDNLKSQEEVNLLKPTGHVIHQQFNIQQLYVQPTLR